MERFPNDKQAPYPSRGRLAGVKMGLGRPPTPNLGVRARKQAWRWGPVWKGHALLLRARRSEFRFPLTEAPGRPTRWNGLDLDWRASEVAAQRRHKQEPAVVAEPVEDSRRGPRAGGDERGPQRSMLPRQPARCACGCLGKSGGDFPGCGRCRQRTRRHRRAGPAAHRARSQKVTVESTSDYWRIWYYLMEAAGLDVQLVNSRDVKNVPGRPKTDLFTELPGRCRRGCVPYRARLARFATRDQRCGCAA